MNRTEARELIARIEEALENAGIDNFELGNSRFSNTELTVKVHVRDAGAETRGQANCRLFAMHYDLPTDLYGREFFYNNEKYKVVGINRRAKKFPIEVERLPDGKEYRFPPHIIRRKLGGDNA